MLTFGSELGKINRQFSENRHFTNELRVTKLADLTHLTSEPRQNLHTDSEHSGEW